MIKLKKVYYSYQKYNFILNNVTMDIKKQSICAIVGDNGAGKTTLLHTLNGLNKLNSGVIAIDKCEIKYDRKSLIDIRKQVGLIFQNPDDQLVIDDPIKDISLGLLNLKLPKDEIDRRVETIVRVLDLENIIRLPIHQMSFGQKKLICLAGVLVMRPKVIVLDEPSVGLSSRFVNKLFKLLNKLKNENQITVVLSTHDLGLVSKYCDDVKVLKDGKIVYDGSVLNLFRNKNVLDANNLDLPDIAKLNLLLNSKGMAVNTSAYKFDDVIASIIKTYNEK
ncbi:MAG: energy-coupling factor ABC transporter ATP-binding protein [Bacilli bacterium]